MPGLCGCAWADGRCPLRVELPRATTTGGRGELVPGETSTFVTRRAPDVRQTGVGRNCDLFRAGMVWAGREANARLDVLAALLIVNQRFAHPLPLSEVRTTARSTEKYRERWPSQRQMNLVLGRSS